MCTLNVQSSLPDHTSLTRITGEKIGNAAVTSARQEEATKAKRGPYLKLSNELKAKIGKHTTLLHTALSHLLIFELLDLLK